MNRGRRARLGGRARRVVVAVVAGVLALVAQALPALGPAEAVTAPSPGTYAGRGFDACTAPAQALMTAWLTASPYRAVGIYIGGVNRGCLQPLLTSSWVSTQQAAGWRLLPIYFGLQPYCTNATNKKFHFNADTAATSGRAAADDAVVRARALGLATGSTVFNDIEGYSTTDPICRTAVLTYHSVWTARLHDLGFLSGFYSSMASGVADQVAVYGSTAYVRPDYLWFSRPDGIITVLNAAIPLADWSHRRIKQYQFDTQTGGPETYGGQPLKVDRDQLDVTPVPATPFGDFTGNGWSDLIARDTSTSLLYLYPGNGTGFGARSRIGAGWNGMSAITRLGDFNRDGHEDVVALESVTGALWLYPGAGVGLAPRLKIGASGWNGMREITPVGDLDHDGFVDLLAIQTSTGSLFLYPGRGTSLAPRRLIGRGWNANSELTGVGDFNRDGLVDLIARHTATGNLLLYRGAGTALSAGTLVGTGWSGMRDLAGVGDFDRDGFTDLIAVQSATGHLFRFSGLGTSFGPGRGIGAGWTALRPLL